MKKFILLAAAVLGTLSASAVDLYVVGANVNGVAWTLAQPDALLEDKGDGIYEWHGKIGSGFKINDGTWDNPDYNFGGSDKLTFGDDYYYENGSNSNIEFEDASVVLENATLILDTNACTIKLTGTASDEALEWYLPGSFNTWATDDATKFTAEGDVYVLKNVTIDGTTEAPATFKVCNGAGYALQFGHGVVPEGEDAPEVLPAEVITENTGKVLLYKNGDNQQIALSGNYDVELTVAADYSTALILFTVSGGSGVEGVEVDENAPVVYYDLNGVRVENPVSGVYVKVVGEKASKVLVAE